MSKKVLSASNADLLVCNPNEISIYVDQANHAIYQSGEDLLKEHQLSGKRWFWEEFSFAAGDGTKLSTFQNVELIITDSGRCVIGGRLYNHWSPRSRQCDFAVMTNSESILHVFQPFVPAYNAGCHKWRDFSWVGNFDSALYELASKAGPANFQISYEQC